MKLLIAFQKFPNKYVHNSILYLLVVNTKEMWYVCNGLPLQMAVSQPHVVDLCFSSEEDESSVGEVDSSYDSILVLSQSDDPLPQVPWRFGKAARNDNVGFNNFLNQIILMYLMFCIYLGGGRRRRRGGYAIRT